MTENDWPALELSAWAPTKRSLHLYTQMLGKLRLALAPAQPNFVFTSLALSPRGFGTGLIPHGTGAIAASIDVYRAELSLESSDGRERRIPLAGADSVAQVFAEFQAALAALDIAAALSPIPQEIADRTPLDRDRRPAPFEPLDAQRFLTVVTATHSILDRWRAHFFGRTSIQLWWGAFDYSLLLFNGKHAEAPADRGYLLKYDLDAEMMNVGFYPGDDAHAPYFYGYIYPQPPGCPALPIVPASATWSMELGEWVLPYDAVRTAADPAAALSSFCDAVYAAAVGASGWDRIHHSYTPPPLRRAPQTA